ncbi:P-loop containing nucleoside triphosphate hydrolase protein [Lipomyces doorenjongii]|uniref:P-loop containing nucleoside triphosphate hydrolase protein n=1 Tax=Lipomyces doorenjongii TaxID=383834 RepID=UPI0034CF37B9
MPETSNFVVRLHNEKEPRGQRYLMAETIARILHEFRDGWLEAELINGYRILISPDKLARYTNGMKAFERFLTSIAETQSQKLAVRSRKRHKPISINRDLEGLEGISSSAPAVQVKTETSEGEIIQDDIGKADLLPLEDKSLVAVLSKRVPEKPSNLISEKRRVGSRYRKDSSDDELDYSSDDIPLARMSILRKMPRPAYTEAPLLHDSFDDEQGDSESNTTNRNLRALRPAKGTPVEHLERNLKRRRGTSVESIRSIRSTGSDRSADISDRNYVKRVKVGKNESEQRPGRSQLVATAKNKKRFPSEDYASEYSRRHIQYCDTCKMDNSHIFDKGQLIHCQGCSFSYHVLCCKQPASRHVVTLATKHLLVLQCRYCIGAETTDFGSQLCFVCGEEGPNCRKFKPFVPHPTLTSSSSTPRTPVASETEENEKLEEEKVTDARMFNSERVMFRCLRCRRCAHYDHFPPVETEYSQDADIVSQYSEFLCSVCAEYTAKVENILAWRPIEKQAEEPSQVVSLATVAGYQREYLVKFELQSYFKVTWVLGGWLLSTASSAQLRSFHRKHPFPVYTTGDAVPEDNYRIEAVLEVTYRGDKSRADMQFKSREEELNSIGEVREVFAKWKGLSFSELFWEEPPSDAHIERYADFHEAYGDYVNGFYIHLPPSPSTDIQKFRKSTFSRHEFKEQPKFIEGGTLMEYQLEGMNWLYFKWFQNKPAILADDMGLGKTIQVISYLSILFHVHGVWPLLVVAPQSTVPNWKREFRRWAPDLRCIAYNGWKEHRQIQQKYQMCVNNEKGVDDLNCHVVITSFNALMDDSAFLNRYKWQSLVVDEGQRLKSDKNMTYKILRGIHTEHKVILTGTPLQNNIRELFNLLQFLNPVEVDAEKLEEKYSEMSESNVVELHHLLQPYFLRRTKSEVLSHLLPKKTEIIVPISMVNLQKRLYKSILAKNPDLLRTIVSKTNLSAKVSASNLNNIFMQLRKCLCHPYLCNQDIEQWSSDPKESLRRLTEACGKLELLSIMLPKLIGSGHRILIFSQFVVMLDILEDFLEGMGISYTRIDGSVTSQDRQQRIDAFNAENSKISVFILSTRAGGVGINLATADTVIVYDPDFNPHQDMQALSRAHRIGQKNRVLVFNLVTRNSVEEKILEIGRRKMLLDQIVIENMGNVEEEHFDLQGILRNGARALFENDEDNIKYDNAAVDKLLERSEEEEVSASQQKEENRFGFARVWENDADDLADFNDTSGAEKKAEEDDTGFWDKILQEREDEIRGEQTARQAQFGRGKRIRDTGFKDVVDRTHSDGNVIEDDDSDQQKRRRKVNSSDSEASFHASPELVAEESEEDFQDVDMEEIDLVMNQSMPSSVPRDSLLPSPATLLKFGTPKPVQTVPKAVSPLRVKQSGTEVMTLHPSKSLPTTPASEVPLQTSVPLVLDQLPLSITESGNLAAGQLVPTSPPPQAVVAMSAPVPAEVLPKAPAALQISEVAEYIGRTEMRQATEPVIQSLPDIETYKGSKVTPLPNPTNHATPLTGNVSESAYSDTSQSIQFVTNSRMPYNPRYPFICDGSHLTHEPGKCPLRTTPVEFCPLCGYAHLAGVQICPQFLSVNQLEFLINAVNESKEPEEFKIPALKYLTFVRKKLSGSKTGRSNV